MTDRFSRDAARRFYDRFGKKQDWQAFYEDRAIEALIRHAGLDKAQSVLEIGCGTGRLAATLLSEHLPAGANYTGLDISATMVGLAGDRLRPWADRAAVHQSDGGFDFARFGGPFDRVIATYVFDLLESDDIDAALAATHGVLAKGGLLCNVGLTEGAGPVSRTVCAIWSTLRRLSPSLVGGCRPLVLADRLAATRWRVRHHEVVVNWGVPSEVLVAEAV